MIEKNRKVIFYLLIAISFLMILLYNVLTPLMSDDYSYLMYANEAHSFWDLLKQEYTQYMTWTGRSVCHMLVRFFFSLPNIVFRIANSVAFVLLSLCIYWNISNKKKHDICVYLSVMVLMWLTIIEFGQTILWETGACNYLWGTTIIMGFVTLFRLGLTKEWKSSIWNSAGMFLFGLLAGWCNENTSGGGELIVLLVLAYFVFINKRKVKLWMVTGVIGQSMGLGFMVLAPGNAIRAQLFEENYSGILKYMARLLKCIIAIKEEFFILLAILLILMVIAVIEKITWKKQINTALFFITFLATSFVLVFTAEPMRRAYFGAGIFLIVTCVQAFVNIRDSERVINILCYSAVGMATLYLSFIYVENSANLGRIYREYAQRCDYLEEQARAGVRQIYAPMLRDGFDNTYTFAYDADIKENAGTPANMVYCGYYEVYMIIGVPRDEFEGY